MAAAVLLVVFQMKGVLITAAPEVVGAQVEALAVLELRLYPVDQAPVALVVAPVKQVVKELHQFRVIRFNKAVVQVVVGVVEYYPVAVVVEVEILVIPVPKTQERNLVLEVEALEVAAEVHRIQCLP